MTILRLVKQHAFIGHDSEECLQFKIMLMNSQIYRITKYQNINNTV